MDIEPLAELLAHCRVREMSARYSAKRNRARGEENPGYVWYPNQAASQDRLAEKWKVRGDALAELMAIHAAPTSKPTNLTGAIEALRAAGGSDWDAIEDVDEYLGRKDGGAKP